MKTIDMLTSDIKNSEALQKLLADAAKRNAIAAFLKQQGCNAAEEEFIAALKAQAEQLDESALDAVAGGANLKEAMLSVFTVGFGCAVVAIVSAAESGVGDGPDGEILCNNDSGDELVW